MSFHDYNAGYYLDWLHQSAIVYLYYMIAMASVFTFVGICSYIKAVVVDLKNRMVAVTACDSVSQRDLHQIECHIIDQMQFHDVILK